MAKIPRRNGRTMTFPIPDTIPGPGTYEAVVLDLDEPGEIPGLETEADTDYLGHGTAEDIPSTSHAPRPFQI